MEIFGYHPDLKKWTEIGNSGCVTSAEHRLAQPVMTGCKGATPPAMSSPHIRLPRPVFLLTCSIFRPEMLLPMGLPEDVRVIAWGLSLVRTNGSTTLRLT